jgi:DNA polymerase III subunit gamma/tau
MLTPGAFNALLKTLEEPPEHVKFIFATTEGQKVPATITSRCQRFDLRRISTDAIRKHLLLIAEKEKILPEAAAAELIARGAEGGLRDAESMLDQCVAFCGDKVSSQDVMSVFGFTSREAVAALLERILDRDAAGGLKIVAEQSEAGKDLSRLLGDLIGQVRDLLIAGVSGQVSAPRDKLLILLDHLAETESRMKWAADKKLQLDVAVIKAAHLLDQASLDEVIQTLAALREGMPPPAPASQLREPEAKRLLTESNPAPFASSSEAIDAAVAWDRVAASYEASIKFRWLTKGVFAEALENSVRVKLPPSSAAALRSVVGEDGRKNAEAKLSAMLGRNMKLGLEIGEDLAESPAEAPPPELPATLEKPTEMSRPKAVDPAEDFKNDPLIKKALEIFAGEIQTATK